MKKLLFRKSLPLILYTLVYIYFIGFNWEVFTVSLNMNLGFGMVKFPPFIILFLLGFIIIGTLIWVSYVTNLQKTIFELEQGAEIGKMKDQLLRSKVQEQLVDEKNVALLMKKMGLPEIQEKQGELFQMLSELKKKLEKREHLNQTGTSQKDN
ncbi:MAG: hypothetical protein U9N53_04025 [Bacteroidota bacterium]|nr:hypothetical protein [Bacteroidota bacterium]